MSYRFERLLDLAYYEQKRRAEVYAESRHEARIRKARYEQKAEALNTLLNTLQEDASEGMPLSLYQAYAAHAWQLKDHLLELKREAESAHLKMQQSEKALLEQRTEKQKYEQLKVRWKTEEDRLYRLQEQTMLDEVALMQHQRHHNTHNRQHT
ncbi:MAG: flagellar FliJ family protein [Candidatus Carbobacillus altaicus]|uniref:Flagellar FliJ protein n=1 Tax=Candidatus Carbonibacillus altaicus TaxID=2163959 RepID=A0A2R6Y4Y6_9BACL|nr:flagellar FliJ family protein [Candidatus Carbobacillus altaicus]PTQ57724.1 MAG: hypothetical protein BSOLF_0919 [Candidatus Carbobacillus altaicus]